MIVLDIEEVKDGQRTTIKPVVRFVGNNNLSISELTMITYMLQVGMYGPAMYTAMVPHLSQPHMTRLSKGLAAMLKVSEQQSDDAPETDDLEAAKVPVIPPNQQKDESNS